jgi:hypothetical protein
MIRRLNRRLKLHSIVIPPGSIEHFSSIRTTASKSSTFKSLVLIVLAFIGIPLPVKLKHRDFTVPYRRIYGAC